MFEHSKHCGIYDQGRAVHTKQDDLDEYARSLTTTSICNMVIQLIYILYMTRQRRLEDDGNKLLTLLSGVSIILVAISGLVASWMSSGNIKYCDSPIMIELFGYSLQIAWILYTMLLFILGWYVTMRVLRRKTYLHGRRLIIAIGTAVVMSGIAFVSDPLIFSSTFGIWDYNPFVEYEGTRVSGGHEITVLYDLLISVCIVATIVFWALRREAVPGPSHVDLNNIQDYQFFVFLQSFITMVVVKILVIFTDEIYWENQSFCRTVHIFAGLSIGSHVIFSVLLNKHVRNLFRRIVRKTPIHLSGSYMSADTAGSKITSTEAQHNPGNANENTPV